MDPSVEQYHRRQMQQHVSDLQDSFRWRLAMTKMLGLPTFAPFAATSKYWADSFRIGKALWVMELRDAGRLEHTVPDELGFNL